MSPRIDSPVRCCAIAPVADGLFTTFCQTGPKRAQEKCAFVLVTAVICLQYYPAGCKVSPSP